jgi:hypothetical protein
MVIQRPQGRGQNPAYRPAGAFFFLLKEIPLPRLNRDAKDVVQLTDLAAVPASDEILSCMCCRIAVETIC